MSEHEPNWQQQSLEKVLLAGITEQRRQRRWNLIFRGFWLISFLIFLALLAHWIRDDETGELTEHTALVVGGKVIVINAVSIAQAFGVSQAVIGVTVVALGTSLPELATSAIAAFKKNPDLAIGNVIGSNIFNVFFVLGISAVIRPLPSYSNLWIDASLAALGSLLLLLFVSTNRHKELKRWQGAFFLACYGVYLVWLLTSL